MTCREFTDFLMDYLSNELTPDARSAFDAHLRVCSNCERYLTSYRESVVLGKHAFDNEDGQVPSTVAEASVKAIWPRDRHGNSETVAAVWHRTRHARYCVRESSVRMRRQVLA